MQRILSLSLVFLLLAPTGVRAQQTSADDCRTRVNQELAREHRLYRAYLFGKKKAEDAPVGSVRYDRDGRAWLKTEASSDPWINSAPTSFTVPWSNDRMDDEDEHREILPIKGIFDTKRVMTSELIPHLLQSIRALECRTATLCDVARISAAHDEDDAQDIEPLQPIGCIEFSNLKTWTECHFVDPSLTFGEEFDSATYCQAVTNQLVRREQEQLKLVVEYDAGFRSLLQFAGNFDIFLREMRWPITGTLRQAAQLIGQLQRIPCFLSSCDSAPPL